MKIFSIHYFGKTCFSSKAQWIRIFCLLEKCGLDNRFLYRNQDFKMTNWVGSYKWELLSNSCLLQISGEHLRLQLYQKIWIISWPIRPTTSDRSQSKTKGHSREICQSELEEKSLRKRRRWTNGALEVKVSSSTTRWPVNHNFDQSYSVCECVSDKAMINGLRFASATTRKQPAAPAAAAQHTVAKWGRRFPDDHHRRSKCRHTERKTTTFSSDYSLFSSLFSSWPPFRRFSSATTLPFFLRKTSHIHVLTPPTPTFLPLISSMPPNNGFATKMLN